MKRKGINYSKVIQTYEQWLNVFTKIQKSLKTATNTHSPTFPPLRSPGYHISGKEIGVLGSGSPGSPQSSALTWQAFCGSQSHQLCRLLHLQCLIQNHMAPSHGWPARVISPLSSPARSLLLPKPCGKAARFGHPWLLCLGLNPSINLPLQPYFWLFPQSTTLPAFPYFSSFSGLP